MLVHRGRRVEHGQLLPSPRFIYGPEGEPIIRTRRVIRLPMDPGRSEVEVFLDAPWSQVLTEDAKRTLEGLVNSTEVLVESAAEDLFDLWTWRRANPRAIAQPKEQWPKGRSTRSLGFAGYAPGTLRFEPSIGMMPPVLVRRLRSAALDDRSRPNWDTFN
jgi:hypothetical protein